MPLTDDDALLPAVATTPDAATTAPAPATPRGRASHVFLFNGRRELLLRRLDAPTGLPHGGTWGSALVANVEQGESYAAAAARALRDTMGLRVPALRFVGDTWVDGATSDRTFLAVFVAAHDGPADAPDLAWVPVQRVLRAVRHDAPEFDAAFLRAFRLVMGDDDAW